MSYKIGLFTLGLLFTLTVNLGFANDVKDKPVQSSPLFAQVEQPFDRNLPHTSNKLSFSVTKLDKLFLTSQITLVAASTADVASSWGKYERNPLLRSSDGSFGRRGLIIKSSLTAVSLYSLNKAPFFKRHRKAATIFSFGMSAFLSSISYHNFRL